MTIFWTRGCCHHNIGSCFLYKKTWPNGSTKQSVCNHLTHSRRRSSRSLLYHTRINGDTSLFEPPVVHAVNGTNVRATDVRYCKSPKFFICDFVGQKVPTGVASFLKRLRLRDQPDYIAQKIFLGHGVLKGLFQVYVPHTIYS